MSDQSFSEALVQACSAGDAQTVQLLVSQQAPGVDLNFSTEGGVTLLMHAIIGAGTGSNPAGLYLETCQLLVQYGVHLETADTSYGRSAAHWATYYHQDDILTELIIAGCDMTCPDFTGTSVFHLTIAEGATKCLAESLRFLPPEILALPDAQSRTPLVHAIQSGNWEALQLLLQAGAEVNQLDEITGRTPLHTACEGESVVMVELLLRSGAVLDVYDASGLTPVHVASVLDGSEALSAIAKVVGNEVLDIPDTHGLTPLMHACAHGNEDNIKLLLKKKVDLLSRDTREEKTCLHWAAGSALPTAASCVALICRKNKELVHSQDGLKRTPLHSCAISGTTETLQVLLTAGCIVSSLDGELHSAVHWAAVSGNHTVLIALLEAGCLVAISDGHGATPLHYAVQEAREVPQDGGVAEGGVARSQRVLQCVEILLQNGAVVTATDEQGMHPIHWALQHPSNITVATLLLAHGADPNAKDSDGMTPLHISAQQGLADNCQFLLEHTGGIHGNEVDSHNQTALFHAVESGDAACVQLLLASGLIPDHRNDNMRAPAHIAATLGHTPVLQLLHTFSADLLAKSEQGATPLHEAAANGHSSAVEFLVTVGCPVGELAGKDGATPLHYAVSGEHQECVRVLLQYDPEAVNTTVPGDQGELLTPLDYCPADNQAIADLLKSCGGLLGTELTSDIDEPAEIDQSDVRQSAEEEAIGEVQEVGVVTPMEPDAISVKSIRPATPAKQSLDDVEFEAQPLDDSAASHVISPQRPHPLLHQDAQLDISLEVKKPGLLKRALSFLKKDQSTPEEKSDSILSSAVGFYSAHATMLAAVLIGTPLGAKTIEVAEKVATDTAEDLKTTAARYKGDIPDLVWLHEEVPERPLTPLVAEQTPPPSTPSPSPPHPPHPPDFTMDAYERRMRKAKAQMDMSKSAGFRAVEELVRAQDTHMRLKRQFQEVHISEDTQQRRQAFQALEDEASQQANNVLKKLNHRIEKAETSSEDVNESIASQLAGAHKENAKLSHVMAAMGVSPRPTVAQWLQGKQQQKRANMQDALMSWDRSKQHREAAILLQQTVSSQRAMKHAAWGARKDLSNQIRALRNQPIRGQMSGDTGGRKLHKSCDRAIRSHDFPRSPSRQLGSGSGQKLSHTPKTNSKRATDFSSSVQATPVGFLKIRDAAQTTPTTHEITPTQPAEDLWHQGQSYARGKFVPLRTKPRPPTERYLRATGPKDVHAERTLHFLHPQDYAAMRTNQIAVEKQLTQQLGLSPRKGPGQRSSRSKHARVRVTSLNFDNRREIQRHKTSNSLNGTTAQYHSLADSLSRRGQLPQQQTSNGMGVVLPMSVLEQHPEHGMEPRQRTVSTSS